MMFAKDLELVLYNGREEGVFELGLTRLQPKTSYSGLPGKTFQADANGAATIEVSISGRTSFHLTPIT